jgi:hypothetical protein
MPSTSAAYLVGYLIVIAGLAYAAHLAHVPTAWIGAGVLVLLGIGVLKMVTKTTTKAPPPPS